MQNCRDMKHEKGLNACKNC